MIMLMLLLSAFFIAVVLTGILRRYALASSLLDIPNDRSSHHIPTPRGGGLAIVGVFLASAPVFFGLDILTLNELWAFLGAGALVALVGFIDDRQHVPVHLRLLAHLFASAWALFWLGVPPIPLFDSPLSSGIASLLGIFYLVWLLNLYNFMDGIDGFAGIEALCVCFGGGLLYGLVLDGNGQYWPLFF
ncbi:MAG: glycosyl transferase, partial [Methylovulum sp.]|nr:glycosyl transferase [Methylovulum sp.]